MANPTNQLNYLLPSKATFDIFGAKEFSFNVQNFKIPRIYGYIAEHPTPHLTVPIPGNKMVYDILEISFLISENMDSWLEMHSWMRSIYQPYGHPEYIDKATCYRQANLTVYSAANNPILRIKFIDLFPVKLDEVIFDVEQTLADPVKTKIELAYRNYDIQSLTV